MQGLAPERPGLARETGWQIEKSAAVEAERGRFAASDGYEFHYRRWRPAGRAPRGYVVGLHGIQSHSGWYSYSSRRLALAGWEVLFLDRRGSGLNRSRRGDAPHWERLVEDVAEFLDMLRFRREGEASRRPTVLMGVSWGGKLAAVTAARRPDLVDALALLYPGICTRIGVRPHQRFFVRLVKWLGGGHRTVSLPFDDAELFTGNPRWQTWIRRDRLSLRRVTVSFLKASQDLDRLAHGAPERLRCPALLMLAGEDRIVDTTATRQYFSRFGSPRRRAFEYPAARHTLEFEPDRERIVHDLIGWLESVHSRGCARRERIAAMPDGAPGSASRRAAPQPPCEADDYTTSCPPCN